MTEQPRTQTVQALAWPSLVLAALLLLAAVALRRSKVAPGRGRVAAAASALLALAPLLLWGLWGLYS